MERRRSALSVFKSIIKILSLIGQTNDNLRERPEGLDTRHAHTGTWHYASAAKDVLFTEWTGEPLGKHTGMFTPHIPHKSKFKKDQDLNMTNIILKLYQKIQNIFMAFRKKKEKKPCGVFIGLAFHSDPASVSPLSNKMRSL